MVKESLNFASISPILGLWRDSDHYSLNNLDINSISLKRKKHEVF